LRAAAGTAPRLRAEAEGIAHLQSTSGSTGTPKLAVVRHRNITANVRAVGAAIGHRPDDVLVTWLPFSHDMGLIGLAYALLWQIPIVVCETTLFVQNPLLWPQWMSRFGGTLSPAPNSAFQMCARLARLRPPRGLNLAAWRVALCGAEPVFETTLQQFRAAFAPAGLRDTTVLPVYGLAEATLAVTISAPGAPLRVDRVDSDALGAEHRAVPRGDGGARSLAVVGVGRAIPGHHLRVVDADGRALPDRQVGEIEFAGPSVVDGYWSKPEAPAALRRPDGFLRTGDLGYLADGILYVTGRHKDLVIVGGRNYSPNQIEAFVENLLDSPVTPAVVAVGVEDPSLGTEQLHLLLDTRLAGGEAPRAVEERVRQGLEEVFGLGGTAVHWVTGGEIPRTHSGKVQRFLCRQLVDARSKGEPEWSLSPSSGSGAAFPAGSRIPDRSGPC
ncbi:MAG TPA: AMP-binding protein, partial [Methylomirabilota bacterium]|nr:AMP-binding protein [Methylomirabilota bacterium]